MVIMTMIGRCVDGLQLCTSVDYDGHPRAINSADYQNQAKKLFKTFGQDSPPQMSIESGSYLFHCYIDRGICYMCLCEKDFSRRLAFSYLEDLATEFQQQYGTRPYESNRPYQFIEFGKYHQSGWINDSFD